MRALVTGGAGLIGSHIVDRLLTRGWDVRILDSLELPTHLRGKPSWVPPEAEFIQQRTESREALGKALEGVDVVFHQAAYQGFLPSFSKFWDVNAGGTALIYELIVEKKLDVSKVVIASSQAVYGESKHRCSRHGDMLPGPRPEEQLHRKDWNHRCPRCESELVSVPTDEQMIDPKTMYAQTKRAQETIGLELGRMYEVPTVALRYAITQGPRQSIYHAYSGVCSIFATRILNDLPPVVYEDGQQLRDYVYVGDVADANILVMERPEADYEIFNVGTGTSVTVLEFLELMGEAFGKPVEPRIAGAYRFGDVRSVRCDNSKLRSLGWEPRTSLSETLKKYVEWIHEQGEVRDYFSEAEAEMKRLGVIRSVAAPS